MTREQLFLSQRALIERVIGWVCAKHGLRGADAEDFRSTVMVRLIEKDYEVVRKFQGLSSFKTYLSAVINRMYLDYQVQRFGKWRPSAEARRLGPVAMRLERLLSRDGLTFDEACGVLLTDPMVKESRDELYAQSLKLPRRVDRRPVKDGVDGPPQPSSESSAVERAERQILADRAFLCIRRSLQRMPPRDRILLRLHFEEGMTVAQIAKLRAEEQKLLYRRKDAILAQLRADLTADGLTREEILELLSTLDWDAALTVDDAESVPSDDAGWPPPSREGPTDPRKGA